MRRLEAAIEQLVRNAANRPVRERRAREAHAGLVDDLVCLPNHRVEPHARAGSAADPRLDLEDIVEARRRSITQLRFDDREPEPGALLERVVIEPVLAPK